MSVFVTRCAIDSELSSLQRVKDRKSCIVICSTQPLLRDWHSNIHVFHFLVCKYNESYHHDSLFLPHLYHLSTQTAVGGLHGNFRASYLSFAATLLRTTQFGCDTDGNF